MPGKEKILWVVDYGVLSAFLDKAVEVGATGVAIRTDNDVKNAIGPCHAKNIEVYGWRWPSAQRNDAMAEAQRAAHLIAGGLDGYFVDPEGQPGAAYDWDQPNLDQLAEDFCGTITAVRPNTTFGVTSHYHAKTVFPHLPWASFFKYATVLLPQSYWRSSEGPIGHGVPSENYEGGLQSWKNAGGVAAKIVPMGGELGSSTAQNIADYVAAAATHNINTLHFYAYDGAVKAEVWSEIKTA